MTVTSSPRSIAALGIQSGFRTGPRLLSRIFAAWEKSKDTWVARARRVGLKRSLRARQKIRRTSIHGSGSVARSHVHFVLGMTFGLILFAHASCSQLHDIFTTRRAARIGQGRRPCLACRAWSAASGAVAVATCAGYTWAVACSAAASAGELSLDTDIVLCEAIRRGNGLHRHKHKSSFNAVRLPWGLALGQRGLLQRILPVLVQAGHATASPSNARGKPSHCMTSEPSVTAPAAVVLSPLRM
ncbi:hypothetical protein LMG27174_01222 [Paraburkholderia rhynchosiae]|uniref:Uncharacterized protein n=1 Tax=Paraburkholderia rhynchosiae TaxID=487049 RepID=A0A6J5A3I4_9BURK|nr:hypothetical protein LMG27174_01222 [Paraburkholderia rhynchosiae]